MHTEDNKNGRTGQEIKQEKKIKIWQNQIWEAQMLLQIFPHIAEHFHAAIPLCLLFGFLKAIVHLEEQSGFTVRRYPVHLKAKKSLDYEE